MGLLTKLASNGAMVVLNLFHFHAGFAHGDATFQAGSAATAITGEHLDAIEGGHYAPLHAAWVERFVALEGAVDLDQHLFQILQVKAGQAVAQDIIAKGAFGADPLPQGGLGQLRLKWLKAGQAEDKSVKGGEKDGGRRDLRTEPRIGQRRDGSAEVENLVQVAGKGREFVGRPVLLFHKCKIEELPGVSVP